MATLIQGKDGKKVVLLNPSERAKRFSRELANGRKENGEKLTAAEAGFRMGVLNERKTQAKIYNKKHGLKGKSKKNKKITSIEPYIDRGRPQDDFAGHGGWF